MKQPTVAQQFAAALDDLVQRVKTDDSVLAAIVCGSLSHDTVWTRSDIDLVLVVVDDQRLDRPDIALTVGDVNVHAMLMPRAEFRRVVDASLHHSFTHSFLAKGQLLFTRDPSIADLAGRLHDIGGRDASRQLLRAATGALPFIDKAHKWFVTRGDLEYTALWLLYAATALARIEVIGAGRLLDREVLPQAVTLNPAFFKTVYTELLNQPKTKARVQAALDAVDAYIASRAAALFAMVIDHLRDVREPRSATEIEHHFKKQFDVTGVTIACEYLAREGLIGRTSTPVRLTKRSRVPMQELAFFFLDDALAG